VVLVQQAEARPGHGHHAPALAEAYPESHQYQSVAIIAQGGDLANAPWLDQPRRLDLRVHVRLDARELGRAELGLRACYPRMDVGREKLPGALPVMMAPGFYVGTGDVDGR